MGVKSSQVLGDTLARALPFLRRQGNLSHSSGHLGPTGHPVIDAGLHILEHLVAVRIDRYVPWLIGFGLAWSATDPRRWPIALLMVALVAAAAVLVALGILIDELARRAKAWLTRRRPSRGRRARASRGRATAILAAAFGAGIAAGIALSEIRRRPHR